MNVEKIGLACHKLKYSGGMERYTLDLINGFSDQSVKVTCFAKKFDATLPEYKKVVPITLSTDWVPSKLRDQLFSRLLKKARQKNHSGPLLSIPRTPYADIAICGGTHLGFLNHTKKKIRMSDRWQINLEHQFYQNAQLIIAHSKMMADELKQLYQIPSRKIEILYPPVDETRFYPVCSKEALKKSLNLPLDKKVFLFPSSSHSRKGYELLEKYFSASDLPIHLAVVGRPLPRPAKNVTYYGYHLNIAPFYQAADFTIMASTYEPFGLVAVESILSGTPVIVSDKLGAGEIVKEDAKLIFESGNLYDLDRIIQQAMSAPFSCQEKPPHLLAYDCSIPTHCQAILQMMQKL